jgi:hypothetical protein
MGWVKGQPRGVPYSPELAKTQFFAKTCPEPNTGCLLWTGALKPCKPKHGGVIFYYGSAKVISPYDGKMMHQAHRISWTLTYGPIPDGLWVLHKCDTPLCIFPPHLFVGTGKDNSRDMVEKRRSPMGETHHNSKLTEQDVLLIRALYAANPQPSTFRELGERFGVHLETIRCIVRRKHGYWHWLPVAPATSSAA